MLLTETNTETNILNSLLKRGTKLFYKKGQTIFYEGLRPLGVFLLRRGKVQKLKTTASGKENMIGIANATCLLGYSDLINRNFYSCNAVVLEEAEVVFIPKADFHHLLSDFPNFFKKLQKV